MESCVLHKLNLGFETVELFKPPKESVHAFDAATVHNGHGVGKRKARVNCFPLGKGIGVWKLVLSLTKATVYSKSFLSEARPMIQIKDFVKIEQVVKTDERVIAACAKRGFTNVGATSNLLWLAARDLVTKESTVNYE
jgi:primary-amine oxidase